MLSAQDREFRPIGFVLVAPERGVRGRGLMVAVELSVPSEPVVAACFERGLLVNNVQPKAVRFVPPLIVENGFRKML